MFGSITAKDIQESLKEKGYEVDKHDILNDGIKQLGDWDVEVRLGYGISATIKVKVVQE